MTLPGICALSGSSAAHWQGSHRRQSALLCAQALLISHVFTACAGAVDERPHDLKVLFAATSSMSGFVKMTPGDPATVALPYVCVPDGPVEVLGVELKPEQGGTDRTEASTVLGSNSAIVTITDYGVADEPGVASVAAKRPLSKTPQAQHLSQDGLVTTPCDGAGVEAWVELTLTGQGTATAQAIRYRYRALGSTEERTTDWVPAGVGLTTQNSLTSKSG